MCICGKKHDEFWLREQFNDIRCRIIGSEFFRKYVVILPNSENIYIVENQKTYHFFVYLTFDGGSFLPTIESNRYSIIYDSNEVELSPLFDEHEESLSYRFGLEYKMSIIK